VLKEVEALSCVAGNTVLRRIIMQKWEYKIVEKSISESKLNELAKMGGS